MSPRTYTISNLAGGNHRTFRLSADGRISARSVWHADHIGCFGGPQFGGPAGPEAARQYEQLLDDRWSRREEARS